MKEIICRCPWVPLDKPDYVEYHDREWGVPIYDDTKIFEFLLLESFQAGLSWYTVLRKRDNYRKAFSDYDPYAVAEYSESTVNSMLQNDGIIRNRLKITSAVNNARRFIEVREEFGSFSDYIWRFVNGTPINNVIRLLADYRPSSRESDLLSRDLKQRGFKFLGTTVCYSHMQATGLVNDHSVDCFRKKEIM